MMNPLKLIGRIIVVSVAVLWAAHTYQSSLITKMLPVIRMTFEAVQDTFVIQQLEVTTAGPNEVLRLRSNFAAPTYVNGRTFYPIGWQSTEQGGFQITLTTGGTLLYSLLTLIVIFSWPAAHWRQYALRLVIALPLMLGLVLLNTTVTFSAELWKPIHDEWMSDMTWPLLVASRMLMGGGGLLLGLLFGAISIAISGLLLRHYAATSNQSSATVAY